MKVSAWTPRKRARRATVAGSLILCWFLAGPSTADAGPLAESAPAVDKSDWESGWHVVRPGDTLEGLAEQFLGSHELWRELHLLNPLVDDPNLLFPGQRLRIFLERPTTKLSAQVMAVARDVRELPTPVPWRPASEGDVLLERDALRTAKSASARLRFDDGATVTLSEDSLVFIRRQTPADSPLPKKEIEIQLGQADVQGAPPSSGGSSEPASSTPAKGRGADAIEVIVAGARSLATPEAGSPVSTRSRRGAGDLAQFMVFTGKSTVSAAGASVEVPAGTGTSVAAKQRPGPVEALLPAPTGLRPAYGEELAQAVPEMSWSAVPGASSYTVEICRDPACGTVLARATGVLQPGLQLPVEAGLPAGEVFWRVTAVAPSGLDGFPSPPVRVEAVDAVRPPAPNLTLQAASGEAIPAKSCLADLPKALVKAVDRRGEDLPWTLLLDGREVSIEEFRHLSLAGAHQVAARVTDARGRTGDSPTVEFTVDAAAPWADLIVGPAGPTGIAAQPPQADARKRLHKRRKEPEPVAACDSGLELLDAGGVWVPVPCATERYAEAAVVALDPFAASP